MRWGFGTRKPRKGAKGAKGVPHKRRAFSSLVGSRRSCGLLRSRLHGFDDLGVAGAAAEIAGEGLLDVGEGRLGHLFEQLGTAHDKAGCAVTALDAAFGNQALLDGMQCAMGGETLDGGDGCAVCAWRGDQT